MVLEQNSSTDELVYIQAPLVAVTIKGSASHPSIPGIECDRKESTLRVSCDDVYDISMCGDPELVTEQNLGKACTSEYRLRPLFFEQQRYEIIIEPEEGHTVEFWHDNFNIRKSITPVGRRSSILSGVINFGNDIGMTDVMVLVDGSCYLRVTIEVFPSKINYKEDYKAIVRDVTMEVYNLVFDFLKKTYDTFDVNSTQQSSPVEFFAIIRKIYSEFTAAADMVLAKPHHLLETEWPVLPSHKVKRTDNQTIRWIEKHPDQAVRNGDRILINRAMAVRKHVTYDTKENRLTKYMLLSTIRRLEQFSRQYTRLLRDTDQAVINQLSEMTSGIRRRASAGFMHDVEAVPSNSGMSLVFSMAPGYRELYRCYLLLQHGLSVTGSIFNMSVKDLAVLYEYWCFIKLNSLMKERYHLISQNVIRISGNGLFVSLVKGQRSDVIYENPDNGERITLSYNPKEISGPTVTQRPDNVLSLKKKGAQFDYEYVFDAKYRINSAPEGSRYQSMYTNPGPQEDDINTMHRYRDAIVYQSQASPFERKMFGAYVLFPYHNETEYSKHHFYESIEKVNIGGLPFLPSATGLVTAMLDELISDSPESAFERATLPIGIEKRLLKVNWSKRDTLVGTFRDNAQFSHCYSNKYYYIPESRISDKELPIHYVAMYQSKKQFGEQAGIQYYGEVLRTESVLRREIDAPMHKGSNPTEKYYCFYVREWLPLGTKIKPKEIGFVHMYTNQFLLENAEDISELRLRSEEEYRLFRELRRKTNAVLDTDNETEGFEMGDLKVLISDSTIQLIHNSSVIDSCTIEEFSQHPNAMFRKLHRSYTFAKVK